MTRTATCPEPFDHARLYATRETSWRTAPPPDGACAWCGLPLPEPEKPGAVR